MIPKEFEWWSEKRNHIKMLKDKIHMPVVQRAFSLLQVQEVFLPRDSDSTCGLAIRVQGAGGYYHPLLLSTRDRGGSTFVRSPLASFRDSRGYKGKFNICEITTCLTW